jgi:hypothetical protein
MNIKGYNNNGGNYVNPKNILQYKIRVGGTEHTAATSTISVSRVIMVGMEII